jgi:hypothetical protein
MGFTTVYNCGFRIKPPVTVIVSKNKGNKNELAKTILANIAALKTPIKIRVPKILVRGKKKSKAPMT